MRNKDWLDFLEREFGVSRTVAREMLHVLMDIKKRETFKKEMLHSGGRDGRPDKP